MSRIWGGCLVASWGLTGSNCCSFITSQQPLNTADRRETNGIPSGQEKRRRREGMTRLPQTHGPAHPFLWGQLSNLGIARRMGSNNCHSHQGAAIPASPEQNWGAKRGSRILARCPNQYLSPPPHTQTATLNLFNTWAFWIWETSDFDANPILLDLKLQFECCFQNSLHSFVWKPYSCTTLTRTRRIEVWEGLCSRVSCLLGMSEGVEGHCSQSKLFYSLWEPTCDLVSIRSQLT